MVHMRCLKRPPEGESLARGGLDCAENLYALLVPLQAPGKVCRENDHKEAIRDIRNTRVSRLHAALDLSCTS